MNGELADRIAAAGMTLAGSLLAVEPERRVEAAGELWARGGWAHADVIGGGYGSRPSVTLEEIRALAAAGGPVDVHLMVDDVAGWITALPTGLARITIQSERVDEGLVELIALARQRAGTVWIGVDTGVAPPSPPMDSIDGTLHMLVPPGLAGHALDPSRLAALVPDAAASTGVDGGVGLEHVDAIAQAGADYVVVGRALFEVGAPLKERVR